MIWNRNLSLELRESLSIVETGLVAFLLLLELLKHLNRQSMHSTSRSWTGICDGS
jgi:hypothetical protein